tara:strand:+ start:24852 stop:25262 length:411 start_codon:yes stop_codon:yes gene_type:complete
MATFGKTSERRLGTAHPILGILCKRVVARRDVTVCEGWRDEVKQNLYFAMKTSKVQWPNSKHNVLPSLAVDLTPYPEMWSSVEAFKEIRLIVLEEWEIMEAEFLTEGFELRHGADWDMDGDTTDQTFMDWPHWELI